MNRRDLSKLAVVLGGAGAGSLTLAACGLPGAGSQQQSTAYAGAATGKILIFNNSFVRVQEELTAVLGETDPQFKPEYVLFPGGINDFRPKMVAMYAGGDIPDAQAMHPAISSLVGTKKLLKPLEEFGRRDASSPLKAFYPGLLDPFRWRDGTYALPWNSGGNALIYNKTLLDRLGIATPDTLDKAGRWNWDAFVTTLRGATRGTQGSPDRTIGLQPINTSLPWICAWIWQNGGDVFSKDGTKCVVNEPAAVDALQWYADLYTRYQAVNFGAPTTQDFPNGFDSGRVAIRQADKQAGPELAKANFALGMAPLPKGKAGRFNPSNPVGFGVANGGPNGDAGWRWVRFMGGPQAAAVVMKAGGTLPIRPAFAQLPDFTRTMAPWENKDVWLESQTTSRAFAQPATFNEINTLWTDTWRNILDQKGSVKALLDDFVRQANAMIAQDG
jgi:multiple sugar transport system substrate-binding protein